VSVEQSFVSTAPIPRKVEATVAGEISVEIDDNAVFSAVFAGEIEAGTPKVPAPENAAQLLAATAESEDGGESATSKIDEDITPKVVEEDDKRHPNPKALSENAVTTISAVGDGPQRPSKTPHQSQDAPPQTGLQQAGKTAETLQAVRDPIEKKEPTAAPKMTLHEALVIDRAKPKPSQPLPIEAPIKLGVAKKAPPQDQPVKDVAVSSTPRSATTLPLTSKEPQVAEMPVMKDRPDMPTMRRVETSQTQSDSPRLNRTLPKADAEVMRQPIAEPRTRETLGEDVRSQPLNVQKEVKSHPETFAPPTPAVAIRNVEAAVTISPATGTATQSGLTNSLRPLVAALSKTTPLFQEDLVQFEASKLQTRGDIQAPAPTTLTPQASEVQSARSIAQQMMVSVQQGADGQSDIRLNPKELGHLRMQIAFSENAISMHITAERTETSDLMRRHIETLAAEFRELGYSSINFSFSEQGQPQDGASGQGDTPDINIEHQSSDPTTLQATLAVEDGLDLRL